MTKNLTNLWMEPLLPRLEAPQLTSNYLNLINESKKLTKSLYIKFSLFLKNIFIFSHLKNTLILIHLFLHREYKYHLIYMGIRSFTLAFING